LSFKDMKATKGTTPAKSAGKTAQTKILTANDAVNPFRNPKPATVTPKADEKPKPKTKQLD
jgi:hypothetical protein